MGLVGALWCRQLAKSRATALTIAKIQLESTSALVALGPPVFSVPECLEGAFVGVSRGGRTGVSSLGTNKLPGSVTVTLLQGWDAPGE